MAAENKLSDKRIRALLGKPQDKQQVISDGRGLSIRVWVICQTRKIEC